MCSVRALSLLVALACLPTVSSSMQGQPKKDKDQPPAFDPSIVDERIVREAKLGVDGPALLKYLRDRTPKEVDPKEIATLVRQLGDSKFAVREKAYADLLALGATALPALKEAAKGPDEEIRKRADDLRKRIEDRADPALQAAVARLIGHRKPEGAAAVLLGYLPFAADDSVIDAICAALPKVTIQGGKVEAVVVDAVKDTLSVKRAAAGAALVTAGAKDHLAAAAALLKDPQPAVRLRVAHALVLTARDKDAVPALISCLKELPADKTWSAEELLLRMAGDNAPEVSLGTDAASQAACFKAWDAWWTKHNKALDLTKIDLANAPLGFTLLLHQNTGKPVAQASLIVELDRAKKVRWKFAVPSLSMDAQVLGPDRVLVVERNGQHVTERDFKGQLKWEVKVPGTLVSAQRLGNGNTFVVTTNQLLEYDPSGKEVWSFQSQNQVIYRGRKLSNGEVVYITPQGLVVRMDNKNKELKNWNVGTLASLYGNIEELPNGNLLIPLYQQNRVVEFDATGKEVWSAQVQNPSTATRLPNGHTLVASLIGRRIVEFDAKGKEVSSMNVDGQIYAARQR
jgi:hypothetical protein